MRTKFLLILSITIAIVAAWAPSAAADSVDDPRLEEVLQVNPGLTLDELSSSITSYATAEGITEEAALEIVFENSETARESQDAVSISPASGGGDDGKQVKLGCAHQGYYTYSFARNYGVNHGHNVLFVSACTAIHAPGPDKNLTKVGSNHPLWHKNAYPAHIRRVNGASLNAHDRAAALAENRWERNLPYNNNFAFNKTVWDSKYNCSQLVWAAWMYASDTDLSGHILPGVYPEDLWKKASQTVLNRYLEE